MDMLLASCHARAYFAVGMCMYMVTTVVLLFLQMVLTCSRKTNKKYVVKSVGVRVCIHLLVVRALIWHYSLSRVWMYNL